MKKLKKKRNLKECIYIWNIKEIKVKKLKINELLKKKLFEYFYYCKILENFIKCYYCIFLLYLNLLKLYWIIIKYNNEKKLKFWNII